MDYKQLVEDFKKDKNSFSAIYNKLYYGLRYFIFGYVKDYDVADDILSNTFYRIYNKIDKYDSELSEFNTWCYAIAKHECLAYLNNRKKYISLDGGLSSDPDDNFSLSDILEDNSNIGRFDEDKLQLLYSEIMELLSDNPINYKIFMYKYLHKLNPLQIVDKINSNYMDEYVKLRNECDININNKFKYRELCLKKNQFAKNNLINESFVKNRILKTEEKLLNHFKNRKMDDYLII